MSSNPFYLEKDQTKLYKNIQIPSDNEQDIHLGLYSVKGYQI